jgi:hypothetical protein
MAALRQTTFTMTEAEVEDAKAWMNKHEADNPGECICRGHRWAVIFVPEHLVLNVKGRCQGCRAERDVTDSKRADNI